MIRVHDVQPGETLIDIALYYYPTSNMQALKRYALSIYRHNPEMDNPNHVYPGMALVIPHHPDND